MGPVGGGSFGPGVTACFREFLEKLIGPAAVVEYYQENGPGTYHHQTLLNRLSQFGLEGY
jgi:hypothetical protein